MIAKDNYLCNYEIVKNKYGKPYFKNSDIYFNISNSSDLSVAIVSNDEVGIDIQKIKDKYEDSLVNKVLTQNEKNFYKNSSNKEKDFTKIWVMKESYLKMLGIGLEYGLKNIDTIENKNKFTIIEYENYYISICYKKDF